MDMLLYNGRIIENSTDAYPILNRSFLYGDAFFETIKVVHGKLLFAADHWQRIISTAEILKMQNPFGEEKALKKDIHTLLDEEGMRNARIRLHIWRDTKGLYKPEGNMAGYLISAEALAEEKYSTSEKGIHLEYYTVHQKSTDILSTLKTANALIYVLASMEIKQPGNDDRIIFNTCNSPVETTSSNLFIVQDGTVITPPLSEGCLNGIMRKNILQICNKHRIPFQEIPLEKEMLEEAEEIFITNVIRGIQWVRSVEDKSHYQHSLSDRLIDLLNEKIK